MEFFKIRRVIPFMRHALVFNVISLLTFLAAVFFLAYNGLHLSVEFTGGTLVEVSYKEAANVEAIRDTLDKAGLKGEVQNFGSSRSVLIRLPIEKDQSSSALSQKVTALLKAQDASAEVRRVEVVTHPVGRATIRIVRSRELLVTHDDVIAGVGIRRLTELGVAGVLDSARHRHPRGQ